MSRPLLALLLLIAPLLVTTPLLAAPPKDLTWAQMIPPDAPVIAPQKIGRASCRERVS